MRDDIYKGAPVPQRWKPVMKDCLSPAMATEHAPERAERALVTDIREDLSSKLFASLSELARDHQRLPMAGNAFEVDGFRRLARSQLDRLVVDHLETGIAAGRSLPEAVEQAYFNALTQWADSHRTASAFYLNSVAPKEAQPVIDRMSNAFRQLPCRSLARELAGGKLPSAVRSRRSPEKLMLSALRPGPKAPKKSQEARP
jgi:hypothetical protein